MQLTHNHWKITRRNDGCQPLFAHTVVKTEASWAKTNIFFLQSAKLKRLKCVRTAGVTSMCVCGCTYITNREKSNPETPEIRLYLTLFSPGCYKSVMVRQLKHCTTAENTGGVIHLYYITILHHCIILFKFWDSCKQSKRSVFMSTSAGTGQRLKTKKKLELHFYWSPAGAFMTNNQGDFLLEKEI